MTFPHGPTGSRFRTGPFRVDHSLLHEGTTSLAVSHYPHTHTSRSRPTSPRQQPMAQRKRAAEEWERRKRGRRRRRSREGQGEGEELGKRQVGTVGWKGDPMEALGEEVMGRVMELLDARSVARCTAVSPAWRGVAADDRLWAPKVRTLPCFRVVGLRARARLRFW